MCECVFFLFRSANTVIDHSFVVPDIMYLGLFFKNTQSHVIGDYLFLLYTHPNNCGMRVYV